jgi:mRNA-degrading endonuclease RelE of RelBE toxin-antitoxin system
LIKDYIPRPAQKQLDNLPKAVGDRMVEKILLLAEEPRPSGTKKLKGYDIKQQLEGERGGGDRLQEE